MDDNQLYALVWKLAAAVLISLILAVTTYNVVDRIGPQRPIVTQSYQAK